MVENFFLASFNSPTPKTPCYTQISPGYLLYKPSDADFVPNFVAMATGVSRRRICLASSNSPTPKTPVICKNLRDISYISRVISDFVPNSVAMATGVILGQI